MSSSKNKPKVRKTKTDYTEQIKRNNPSYKYNLKTIMDRITPKKVNKKSEGGDIKVKKIDPLSERLDKAGLRGGAGRYKGLTKKDKKVVDAFYKGKEASSNKLTSDGKTLEIMGLGRQNIAKRDKGEFGDFNITAKPSGRTTQSILRYIKKTFPKDRIKKDATKMVKQEDSFNTRYSGNKFRDIAANYLKSKNIKYEKVEPSQIRIKGVPKSQRIKLMDKIEANQDRALKLPKKKNKGGLLVTPKLAKRGF